MGSPAMHVIPHAKPKYTSGCGMNVRHSFLPILTVVVYNVFFPHISCTPQNYDSWDNGLPLWYCGICFFHICNMRVHKASWWNRIYLLLYLYHTPLISACNTPGCRACKFDEPIICIPLAFHHKSYITALSHVYHKREGPMVVLWMILEQKNMQTNSIIQPPPLPYHLQSGNDPRTVDITPTRNIAISSPNGDLL